MKHARSDEEIGRCFPVMAELRTHLKKETFVSLIRRLESEGYRLAFLDDGDEIVAVAGYRISTNLFLGKNLYVDDLVTARHARSRGHGTAMLAGLRRIALENGCDHFHLDSGTQRKRAHKFYFRHGLSIASYHFDEKLAGDSPDHDG